MKIFNTLTRSKQELITIEKGKVKIYAYTRPFITLFTSATQDRSAFLMFFAVFLNISATM